MSNQQIKITIKEHEQSLFMKWIITIPLLLFPLAFASGGNNSGGKVEHFGGGGVVDNGGGFGELQAVQAYQLLPEIIQYCLSNQHSCSLNPNQKELFSQIQINFNKYSGILPTGECGVTGKTQQNFILISSCELYFIKDSGEAVTLSFKDIFRVVLRGVVKALNLTSVDIPSNFIFTPNDIFLRDFNETLIVHQNHIQIGSFRQTHISLEYKEKSFDISEPIYQSLGCKDLQLNQLRFQQLNSLILLTGQVRSSCNTSNHHEIVIYFDPFTNEISVQILPPDYIQTPF